MTGSKACATGAIPPRERSGPAATTPWEAWTRQWDELREAVGSEWKAAREAFLAPGSEAARKWLGWALFRLAARVNPEVRD